MTLPAETIWGAIVILGTVVGFLFRRYDAAQTERIKEYREQLLPAVSKMADAFHGVADGVNRVLDIIESGAGDRSHDRG